MREWEEGVGGESGWRERVVGPFGAKRLRSKTRIHPTTRLLSTTRAL